MKRPIKAKTALQGGGIGNETTRFRMLVSFPIIRETRLNYKDISAEFLGSVKGKR